MRLKVVVSGVENSKAVYRRVRRRFQTSLNMNLQKQSLTRPLAGSALETRCRCFALAGFDHTKKTQAEPSTTHLVREGLPWVVVVDAAGCRSRARAGRSGFVPSLFRCRQQLGKENIERVFFYLRIRLISC